MATSEIIYNDFTFPYTTLEVASVSVYGDDGATQIGTRYNFSIAGVISAIDATAFKGLANEMHAKLGAARKNFYVRWTDIEGGGSPQTHFAFGPSESREDGYGPQPGELILTRYAGGLAANYSWSLSVFKKECFTENCDPIAWATGILQIVRRFDYSIDMSGLTTRTISGKLLLSSYVVSNGTPADAYRYTVTPPIPINFQRMAQQFSQSEDGRELIFSFTDVEQVYTLPQPITNGAASFSVRVQHAGALADFALSGFFEVPAGVPKSIIIDRIAQLALAKFPQGAIYDHREITESVYSPNRVDFHITAIAGAGVQPGTNGAGTALENLVMSPPNEQGLAWPIYPDGGDQNFSSGVLSPVPTIWEACNNPSLSNRGIQQRGQVDIDRANPSTPSQGPGVGSATGVSSEHQNAPYIAYHEVISYEIDNKIVFFEPMTAKAAPIMQQVGNPTLHLIQAGYAARLAAKGSDGPKAAKPVGGDSAKVMQASVTPHVPEPIGDGSVNKYTVHWRYVIRVSDSDQKVRTQIVDSMKYPLDPRRNLTEGESTALQPPEILSQPQ